MKKVPYIHNTLIHNTRAAQEIVPRIIELFNPKSVVDVGCGIGTWLSVFKEKGIEDILGIDGDFVNQNRLTISVENFLPSDLEKKFQINRKFDLALSLEVAEHLRPESADTYIESLTSLSDIIIFSAAIPGQGGQNHLNEQWPDYWEKKFRSRGFISYDNFRTEFWENQKIEWWYRQNILLYAKVDNLNLVEKTPLRFVHPELFLNKNDEIKVLRKELVTLKDGPGIIFSLKLLAKSIINKFKGLN